MSQPPSQRPAGEGRWAGALALLCFLVFLASPNHPVTDSHFTMLLSENLLRNHSFALDRYFVRPLDPAKYPRLRPEGYPTQIREENGHLYYFFPAGSSVLSIPFVAVMNRFGLSAINPDRTYSMDGERRMQAIVAAALMAGLAAVLFGTARLYLPLPLSLAAALFASLGTQVWSTASRALWSVTWQLFLFGLVLWLLAAHEARARKLPPVALATLLAWAYFVRPTSAVFIVAVGLYVLAYERGLLARFVAAGVFWLAAFVAYSYILFGTPVPAYYEAGRLSLEGFGTHVAGNLIAPSRGLLVFSPVVALIAYWLARHRRRLPSPRLVGPALLAVGVHLAAVSCFPDWTGGHSYGPRLTADLVPWLFLLGVIGLRAALDHADEAGAVKGAARRRWQLVMAAVLGLWGVFAHGRGALAAETWLWNTTPELDPNFSRRVWDWRYPQFLAGLIAPPGPGSGDLAYPPYALGRRILAGEASAERYLAYGWGRSGDAGRWSTARQALVAFSLERPRPATLRMQIVPYLGEGRIDAQRVMIELNGSRLRELVLTDPGPTLVSIPLPAETLGERNLLVFGLPDARSPKHLGQGRKNDPRAIALEWIELLETEELAPR